MSDSEKFLKAQVDLENQPLTDAQYTFFVDGSCFHTDTGNKAGYAVIETKSKPLTFEEVMSVPLPQPCSAQLAEIMVLMAACKLGNGKRCTIYTDSAYAHGVCHVFGQIWAQSGFQRTDSSTITHGAAISDLLHAMSLPTKLAIVKCKAHKTDDSFVTRGNTVTNEAAKKAAIGPTQMMALTNLGEVTDRHPQETNSTHIVELQNMAGVIEISTWIKRGTTKEKGTGLWRSVEELCVAPASFLPMLIKDAHGLDHTHRAEVNQKICKDWWSPY